MCPRTFILHNTGSVWTVRSVVILHPGLVVKSSYVAFLKQLLVYTLFSLKWLCMGIFL